MSLKVYLAGGFYQEDDWRYSMVKGLKETVSNPSKQWTVLTDSIFGCLDFVGPYPNNSVKLHREAIENADLVFLWFSNGYTDDLSKMGFELGYAAGLKKDVIYGYQVGNEPGVISFSIFGSSHSEFIADTPTESLQRFLSSEWGDVPIEWLIKLRKYGHTARKVCGQQIDKAGYVYVIKADTGHYKIGRTNNVPNRIKLFSVKLPFDFDIVNYFPCRDMFEAENSLHTLFAEYRTNGEWFNLPQDRVNLLKSVTEASGGLFRNGNNETIDDLCLNTGLCWYTDEEGKLISR